MQYFERRLPAFADGEARVIYGESVTSESEAFALVGTAMVVGALVYWQTSGGDGVLSAPTAVVTKPIPAAPQPKPSNVINLMDALRRSVDAESGRRATAPGKTSAKTHSAAKKAAPAKSATKRRVKKAS